MGSSYVECKPGIVTGSMWRTAGASSGSAGSQTGDTQASSGGEVSADEGDVIKIGLISMMTGDNPLNGERMNQGYRWLWTSTTLQAVSTESR